MTENPKADLPQVSRVSWEDTLGYFEGFLGNEKYSWSKHMVECIRRLMKSHVAYDIHASTSLGTLVISTRSDWPMRHQVPHVAVHPSGNEFEVQIYLDTWPNRGYWNDSRPFRKILVPYFRLTDEVLLAVEDIKKATQETP